MLITFAYVNKVYIGIKIFPHVKLTKQKGFGTFDIAGYWRRNYREKQENEGWYLLTNLGEIKKSVDTFKCRSGIEAMLKNCKTGGYNARKEPR